MSQSIEILLCLSRLLRSGKRHHLVPPRRPACFSFSVLSSLLGCACLSVGLSVFLYWAVHVCPVHKDSLLCKRLLTHDSFLTSLPRKAPDVARSSPPPLLLLPLAARSSAPPVLLCTSSPVKKFQENKDQNVGGAGIFFSNVNHKPFFAPFHPNFQA